MRGNLKKANDEELGLIIWTKELVHFGHLLKKNTYKNHRNDALHNYQINTDGNKSQQEKQAGKWHFLLKVAFKNSRVSTARSGHSRIFANLCAHRPDTVRFR